MARKSKPVVEEQKLPAATPATEVATTITPEQTSEGQTAEGQSGAVASGGTSAAAAPQPGADKVAVVKAASAQVAIRTKGRGITRRRAAMRFGPEPQIVEIGSLSKEQWAAIEADPLLLVEPVKKT